MQVRLVTRDKAFLTDGALSNELGVEADGRGISVIASPDLESVLKELQRQGAPGFDVEGALKALNAELGAVHSKLLQQWSLSSLGPHVQVSFEPFYTEDPRRLYLTFRLRYGAGTAVVNGTEYSGDHQVELIGSYSFYPQEGEVKDLQVEHERLIASDGSVIAENRTVFLIGGSFVTGRRTVPYQIKRPLLEGLHRPPGSG